MFYCLDFKSLRRSILFVSVVPRYLKLILGTVFTAARRTLGRLQESTSEWMDWRFNKVFITVMVSVGAAGTRVGCFLGAGGIFHLLSAPGGELPPLRRHFFTEMLQQLSASVGAPPPSQEAPAWGMSDPWRRLRRPVPIRYRRVVRLIKNFTGRDAQTPGRVLKV